jgi:hypothetical protein
MRALQKTYVTSRNAPRDELGKGTHRIVRHPWECAVGFSEREHRGRSPCAKRIAESVAQLLRCNADLRGRGGDEVEYVVGTRELPNDDYSRHGMCGEVERMWHVDRGGARCPWITAGHPFAAG